MKLDQLRVPLIPRSNIDCFDLGIMFFGRHFLSIVRLWFWVAVPAMLLTYLGAWYQQLHLGQVLLGLFFLTGAWSILLVGKISQTVFGESFGRFPATRKERTQLAGLMFQALGARCLTLLGFFLFVLPGWWIGVRTSFFPEKRFLSTLKGRSHDRRTSELIQQELGQLTQRSLSSGLITCCVVVSLFATLDFFCNLLFQQPILWGRLIEEDRAYLTAEYSIFDQFFDLLTHDPLVLSAVVGVVLFVYPIVRFAWFFSYIDLRVRGDFWDLELQFQKEVERLQESPA